MSNPDGEPASAIFSSDVVAAPAAAPAAGGVVGRLAGDCAELCEAFVRTYVPGAVPVSRQPVNVTDGWALAPLWLPP
jgi:hypothetical protein